MSKQQPTVGHHIRSEVIPAGMSVKGAAARLGVGRPALSNLLNGKAALSPKMAMRLAKAFGADSEALLQLQAQQDRVALDSETIDVAVRRYVPRALTIRAADIERWADTVVARTHLPVLLRKLVHGTGQDLHRVDFPGGDNSQRAGWDGWVEAGAATAWIPAGESGWEFGTSKDPRQKAERDYEKRLGLPPSERGRCVFVFVTPRNWPGKADWARKKEASGDGWRAVRAYDASDLEQWLDESVVAPVWLGEKLPLRIAGTKTLDQCWADWANATEPKMTKHIFQSATNECVEPFNKWLHAPPRHPFVVAADSEAETLAFLACLFEHPDLAARRRDLAAVFERAEALTMLSASSAPFIPIAANAETQQPLASLRERLHCIAICPRNAVGVKPDYAFGLLDYEAFREGVEGMGFGRHEVERLVRESGRSPTILRRRLALLPALKTPQWASDHKLARSLIPLCLVGAWNAHASADREVLAALADCHVKEVENGIAHLQKMEDSPVWAVGEHRGVTSKVDVLFSVADLMTEQHINDLLAVAEYVLSESDPALELPETDRWAAVIHGKVRDHSAELRGGLCETLVLFSVHGNELFQERLGINVEAGVSDLVARLLTPLDEKLDSQERDLPAYAEAAPHRFLALLEADMRKDAPALLRLLKPVSSHPFTPCPRSGLLWALECVAWNPAYIGRVALLLAELSRVRIDDNILNKPINSLASLIRSWKPQTAASLEQRVQILAQVATRYPAIGWRLCLDEVNPGPRFASDNYRPRWRSDATGAGGVASVAEAHTLVQCAARILLSWHDHNHTTLGDLVERIDGLPSDQRDSVWDKIDAWAATEGDEAKAELQVRIRRFAFTRRQNESLRSTVERARVTHDQLQPCDPVVRHAWLFAEDWPQDVWEETTRNRLDDFEAQRKQIDGWRRAAMDEIWDVYGLRGALMLVEKGGHTAGPYVARHVARHATDAAGVLRECLGREENAPSFDAFMREFIERCADPADSGVLRELSTCLPEEPTVRLWRCAPFREQTWRALDGLPEETRTQYWKTVSPSWLSKSECTEFVERLSEAGRPFTAFRAVHPFWKNVETGCLKRLLTAILASDGGDPTRIEPHQVSAALSSLAARGVVSEDEMANLEFAFIGALEHSEHGIPNLERQLSKHPALFVRILAHLYKRDDEGEDPPEWHIEGEARQRALWHAAYHTLRLAARIPGTDQGGVLHLEPLCDWLVEARNLCAKCGRSRVGDQHIGELLSKAAKDGAWPPVVCEALERLRSEEVARGLYSATLNARGVVVGTGGDEDRELAAKFRRHAKQRRADYPFTSSVIYRIAKHYELSARHKDERATLAKRLNTWG